LSFLRAAWRKLALANYIVDPQILAPFVPRHTELDLWNDRCYVSLVGFLFENTRLLGLPIPGHTTFEEVNLRFYVRYQEDGEWKRGVVFIREIVPRAALAWVANVWYREHYVALPMRHSWSTENHQLQVSYSWRFQGKWQHLTVKANPEGLPLEPGSEAEFITEHYWGYTRVDARTTYEYQVTHPSWLLYPVDEYALDVDFGALYGPEFAFLSRATPCSVMLAEGSAITVEAKRKLPNN